MGRFYLKTWLLYLGVAVVLNGAIFEDTQALAQLANSKTTSGEAVQPNKPNDVLRFRRVFVPAQHPEQWPRDGSQKYLAMPAEEFQRRIAQLQGHGSPSYASRLVQAVYSAELTGDLQLKGTGKWTFEIPTGKPEVVTLPNCRLPLRNLKWNDKRRAVAGNDAQGKFGVWVESAGVLEFSWSAQGARDASGNLTFATSLPHGAATVCHLTIPDHLTPEVQNAIITSGESSAEGNEVWMIECGGADLGEIRLVKRGSHLATDKLRRSLPLIHQTTKYEISRRGLDVNSEIHIEGLTQEKARINLRFDRPLMPVSVFAGQYKLNLGAIEDGDGQSTTMSVDLSQLPAESIASAVVLKLRATAPWKDGIHEQLPLVNVESSHWQSATATLRTLAPLVLEDLSLDGCRQVPESVPASNEAGETIALQFFTATPKIIVKVALPRNQLEWIAGTSLSLRPSKVTASLQARFTATAGEAFELNGNVPTDWVVDSVETSPAGAIADWTFQPGRRNRAGKLHLQLREPIRPGSDMTFIVTGHRQRPLGERTPADRLFMLSFPDAKAKQQWIQFQTPDTHELVLHGENVRRLDTAGRALISAEIFSDVDAGAIYPFDEMSRGVNVSLIPKTPTFQAESRCEAAVSDDQLTEVYDFTVVPEGRELNQLLVHFSQPREAATVWKMLDGARTELSARRLSEDEMIARGIREGETWEVSLALAQSKSFRLQAQRTTAFLGETPVALASIIEAQSQQGTVSIYVAGATTPQVQCVRLKVIPTRLAAPGTRVMELAAFRYDPEIDTLLSSDPPLVLIPQTEPTSGNRCWIWHAQLKTYLNRAESDHVFLCQVENAGRDHIQFTLPEGSDLRGIVVDGQSVVSPAQSGASTFKVSFSPSRRFIRIELRWSSETRLPVTAARFVAPWPSCDVPVLSQQWMLAMPPEWWLAESNLETPATSLSWEKRLLGPLARGQNQPVFNPFSLTAWTSLILPDRQQKSVSEPAEYLINRLKELRSGSENATTWGGLLLQATADLRSSDRDRGIDVFVDDSALRQIGIYGQTPLTSDVNTVDSNGTGRAFPFHEDVSQLAFVAHPKAIIITTQDGISRLRNANNLSAVPGPYDVYTIAYGPLFDLIEHAEYDTNAIDFPPIEQWGIAPSGLSNAWNGLELSAREEKRSWAYYWLDGASHQTHAVIVNRMSFTLIAWAAFFLASALRYLLGERSVAVLALIFGVAIAVALLAPAWLAVITSAAWLGIVAGQLIIVGRGCLRTQTARPELSASGQSGVSRAVLATATSIALWLAWSNRLGGQEHTETTIVPNANDIPSVLVPVDENFEFTGGAYYLPEPFYQTLIAATPGIEPSAPEYLVTSATYRPEAAEVGKALSSSVWLCAYEIEALSPETVVRLPLGSEGATLVPDGVQLDGQSVPIRWNELGRHLEVVIPKGTHRVDVKVRPNPRQDGISFSVPQVCHSSLVISQDDLPRWKIFTANATDVPTSGFPKSENDNSVPLGPVERITIQPRLSQELAERKKEDAFHVDEMYWLRIRPGSVVVDARFRFKEPSNSSRQFTLEVDPRLRPIQMGAASSAPFTLDSNDPGMLIIESDRGTAETRAVNLSFLVQDATGVGKVQLPWTKVVGATSRRIHWGISVDPSLHSKEIDDWIAHAATENTEELKSRLGLGPEVELVAPQDFHTAWGGGELSPQFALRSLGNLDWGISTAPRQSQLAASYRLGVSLGADSAQIRAAIDVTSAETLPLSLRLAVPTGLQIDDVLVMEQDRVCESRWSQGSPDTLTIFLGAPLTNDCRILLNGSTQTDNKATFTLPPIHVHNCLDTEFKAIVLRRSMILAHLQNAAAVKEIQSDGWPAEIEDARRIGIVSDAQIGNQSIVGVFYGQGGIAPVEIRTEPNRPQLIAQQLTTMNRTSEGWFATVSLQLDVKEGLVDALRLDLPPNWRGPFAVSPSVPFSIENLAQGNRQQLVVRYRPPLAGSAHLQITGPVTPAAGERPSAPHVTLVNSASTEQYFLLPRQSEGQLLSWDVRGLVTTNQLPKAFTNLTPHLDRYRSFQLTTGQFRAVFRSAEAAVDKVRVRLANTAISWGVTGQCAGVSSFDIEAGGATSVRLELPTEYQLIQARVDGIPAQLIPLPDNQWDVFLGMNKLPRRLEVIFNGKGFNPSAASWQLFAPTLPGVTVDRSLWTIYAPATAGQGKSSKTDLFSPLRYELYRIAETASLIDATASILLEEPPADVMRWSSPWIKRFVVSRDNAQRMRILAPQMPEAREVVAQVEAVENDQLRLARRLNAVAQWNELSTARPAADDAIRVWMSSQPISRSALYGMTLGDSGSIALSYPEWRGNELSTRIWLVVAISFVLAAVVLGTKYDGPARSRLPQWRQQFQLDTSSLWPQLLIIIFGIGWWLWCIPSVLGLVIALAGMILLAAPLWKIPALAGASRSNVRASDASHSVHSSLSQSKTQRYSEAVRSDSQAPPPKHVS